LLNLLQSKNDHTCSILIVFQLSGNTNIKMLVTLAPA
jgi:hypothetical protein